MVGKKKSHTSAECKVLSGDKQKYSNAMRKASGPNDIPGGSTKVNGQIATNTTNKVKANLVEITRDQYDADEDDLQNDEDAEQHETAMFLQSVLSSTNETRLNESGYLAPDYPTTHATAMMMEDDIMLLNDGKRDDKAPAIEQITQPPATGRNPLAHSRIINENWRQRDFDGITDPDEIIEIRRGHQLERRKEQMADSKLEKSIPVSQQLPTTTPKEYTLIEDGSQFGTAFWRDEAAVLTNFMQALHERHPHIPLRTIPSPEDLHMQFIQWIVNRPHIPPLAAPASSGFYDDIYGGEHRATSTEPKSTFFDDAYVSGKLQAPVQRDNRATTLNPALRDPITYKDACTATLTTVAEIERHEKNIYQPGYTPTAIRDSIQRVLRDSNPDQHLVDFQEKDIPPVTRDLRTH